MRKYGVAIAVLLASLWPATPAVAVDGYSSAPNGVLYDGCLEIPVNYSIALPPGTTYWNLDLVILGPDGLEEGSDYLSLYLDDVSSGTANVQLCSDTPGRYTVEASGEYELGGHTTAYQLPSSSFSMRQAKTKTTLTVSPRNPSFNDRVTFKVRVKDERPNGFFPSAYVDEVVLQIRVAGRWKKARRGDFYIDDDGKGSLTYKWNVRGPQKVRAVTKPDDNLAGSTSRILTVR